MGEDATSSRAPTTSSRSGFTASSGCARRRRARGDDYEFRTVTEDDLKRERIVEEFIAEHLADWQDKGWVPDMRIEPGDKTDRADSRRAAGHTGTTCSTRGSCWLLGLLESVPKR